MFSKLCSLMKPNTEADVENVDIDDDGPPEHL